MRVVHGIEDGPRSGDGRLVIRGYDLRYVLTAMLMVDGGVMTVAELAGELRVKGFATRGRTGKLISDCLRSEVGWGRVERVGRGKYRAGPMPRTTRWRISSRARALEQHAIRADATRVSGQDSAAAA